MFVRVAWLILAVSGLICVCHLSSEDEWKEACRTDNKKAICDHHELADYCELFDYCSSNGLFKRKDDANSSTQERVGLALYYEARCPFSIFFLMRNLVPAFNHLHTIMDVDLIPYGFATKRTVNGSVVYECQHGPEECHGNRLHACAMDMLNVTSYVPYLGCMAPRGSTDGSARVCAKDKGIDWHRIVNCSHGTQGEKLFQQVAAKTEQLKPKFKTLPWVLFNGKYSEEVYESSKNDTIEVICSLYEGRETTVCPKDYDKSKRAEILKRVYLQTADT